MLSPRRVLFVVGRLVRGWAAAAVGVVDLDRFLASALTAAAILRHLSRALFGFSHLAPLSLLGSGIDAENQRVALAGSIDNVGRNLQRHEQLA